MHVILATANQGSKLPHLFGTFCFYAYCPCKMGTSIPIFKNKRAEHRLSNKPIAKNFNLCKMIIFCKEEVDMPGSLPNQSTGAPTSSLVIEVAEQAAPPSSPAPVFLRPTPDVAPISPAPLDKNAIVIPADEKTHLPGLPFHLVPVSDEVPTSHRIGYGLLAFLLLAAAAGLGYAGVLAGQDGNNKSGEDPGGGHPSSKAGMYGIAGLVYVFALTSCAGSICALQRSGLFKSTRAYRNDQDVHDVKPTPGAP